MHRATDVSAGQRPVTVTLGGFEMPGPVPKRSSQRRRRNTAQVDRIPVRGPVDAPPLDLEDVHPLAAAMYEALAKSAQAVCMEPSDWEYARWTAFIQSKAAQK